MRKKVAIRKLNRTLLKKEGTKEVYITGKNVLMPFFGYKNIEDLATSRKEETSKREFMNKRIRNVSDETRLLLSVTRENNEVRLTGFEDFFVIHKVNEVDQIVLESIEDGDQIQYLLDYIRCASTRVLQKFEPKDSCDNYSINMKRKEMDGNAGGRETISFRELDEPVDVFENTYWLWDDAFNENRWNELVGNELEITFLAKGHVDKKKILIVKTGKSIKKLLKARSSSSNQVETQEKELYEIKEYTGNQWVTADFGGIKYLELVDEGNRIKISNRDIRSFCLFEGGEIE